MPNTFINRNKDVTNSQDVIYNNTSGGTAIVLTLRVTNVNGGSADQVTVEITDSLDAKIAHIAYEMDVPSDTSVELAGVSKIVLESGDKLKITGTQASGYLEAFASILEIT